MTISPATPNRFSTPERAPYPERVLPVDYLPAVYPVAVAAERAVQPVAAETRYEPGTVGAVLHQMFLEADQLPPTWVQPETPREQREHYTTEQEMWQGLLAFVQRQMKESPVVQNLRRKASGGGEISSHDIEGVFHVYERSLRHGLEKFATSVSRPIRNEMEQAVAHLDWSMKDVMAEHIMSMNEGQAELYFNPHDIFLLLNPSARKIKYMGTAEVKRVIHRVGSLKSSDTIKHDLHTYGGLVDEVADFSEVE